MAVLTLPIVSAAQTAIDNYPTKSVRIIAPFRRAAVSIPWGG